MMWAQIAMSASSSTIAGAAPNWRNCFCRLEIAKRRRANRPNRSSRCWPQGPPKIIWFQSPQQSRRRKIRSVSGEVKNFRPAAWRELGGYRNFSSQSGYVFRNMGPINNPWSAPAAKLCRWGIFLRPSWGSRFHENASKKRGAGKPHWQ